jgi:hypothetical protein
MLISLKIGQTATMHSFSDVVEKKHSQLRDGTPTDTRRLEPKKKKKGTGTK